MFNREPLELTQHEIATILKSKPDSRYVCDHDLNSLRGWSIFYSANKGTYFAVCRSEAFGDRFNIKEVPDFESYKIHAVEAYDGEIIHSRFPLDYRESSDQTVWVDGGCMTNVDVMHPNQRIVLVIKNGEVLNSGEHW